MSDEEKDDVVHEMFKSTLKNVASQFISHPKAGRIFNQTDGPIPREAGAHVMRLIDEHPTFFFDAGEGQ